MYARLAGRLPRYPIPVWPWPHAFVSAAGRPRILDLGCGWGRWSFSAARAGLLAVGVDRSLPALRAARRAAAELTAQGQLQVTTPHWVCADLDRLPFRANSFDQAIAYGVWQYLPGRGRAAAAEAWALLRPNGRIRIQLPHRAGPRARALRLLAALGRSRDASVTYWTLSQMRQLAPPAALLDGSAWESRLTAEGFFSTNAQWEDRDLLPFPYRCLVAASRFLCHRSRRFPALMHFADAIWLEMSAKGIARAR